MRCAAYCTAASFDNSQLLAYMRAHFNATRYREVIHIQLSGSEIAPTEGNIFFFAYGAIVCWGLNSTQEKEILNKVKAFEMNSLDLIDEDSFTYTYGAAPSILEDEIVLPDHFVLTKLALSYGFAQSVKLDIFERTVQKMMHLPDLKNLPEFLAREGKIKLKRKDIRRMMGRLFIDINSINLHQELLNTPEFFWEHTDLEPLYHQVSHYIERDRRVNSLNQGLRSLQDLFNFLTSELNHQHSSFLEWIIIALILVEVAISFAKDIFQVL